MQPPLRSTVPRARATVAADSARLAARVPSAAAPSQTRGGADVCACTSPRRSVSPGCAPVATWRCPGATGVAAGWSIVVSSTGQTRTASDTGGTGGGRAPSPAAAPVECGGASGAGCVEASGPVAAMPTATVDRRTHVVNTFSIAERAASAARASPRVVCGLNRCGSKARAKTTTLSVGVEDGEHAAVLDSAGSGVVAARVALKALASAVRTATEPGTVADAGAVSGSGLAPLPLPPAAKAEAANAEAAASAQPAASSPSALGLTGVVGPPSSRGAREAVAESSEGSACDSWGVSARSEGGVGAGRVDSGLVGERIPALVPIPPPRGAAGGATATVGRTTAKAHMDRRAAPALVPTSDACRSVTVRVASKALTCVRACARAAATRDAGVAPPTPPPTAPGSPLRFIEPSPPPP